MGRPAIDMAGKRFGKLVVIERAGANKFGHPVWKCICDCGNKRIVKGSDLRAGQYQSCGCSRVKHGMARRGKEHPLFELWRGMIKRCMNPKATGYQRYGGRGIMVCKRWMDIRNFIADMSPRPSLKHTLDRIDNNKGYSPNNCRWATIAKQNRNQRRNRMLTFQGQTMCVSEWGRLLGIPKNTLLNRLKKNWPIEKVLSKRIA